MDIISKIKKGLIILSIPAAVSCSNIKISNIEAYKDDMYPANKIVRVEKPLINNNISPRNINPEYKENIESKVNSPVYYDNYYSNSVNQNYFRDSDGDGIINTQDPAPYRFGPYIDSNFNGIVDFGDIMISSRFNNFYGNTWNYPLNYQSYGYFNPYYNSNSLFYSGYNNYFYPRNNIIIYTIKENSNVVYGKRPSREEFSDKTQNRINNTNNSRSNRSNNTNTDVDRQNNSGRINYNTNPNRTNNNNQIRQNNWNMSPNRSEYNNNRNYTPRSSQPSSPPVQRTTTPIRRRDN